MHSTDKGDGDSRLLNERHVVQVLVWEFNESALKVNKMSREGM